jgi:hypothetical protein
MGISKKKPNQVSDNLLSYFREQLSDTNTINSWDAPLLFLPGQMEYRFGLKRRYSMNWLI